MLNAGSMNVLEKIFQTAANFLEEGSQETRTRGKRILCIVRQLTSSISYDEFRRLVARLPGEKPHAPDFHPGMS